MPEKPFQIALDLANQRLEAIDRELAHHRRMADRLRLTTDICMAGAALFAFVAFVF